MTDKEKQKLVFNLDLYQGCKVTHIGENIKCEFDSLFHPTVIFQYHTAIHHDRRETQIRVNFSFNDSSFFFFVSSGHSREVDDFIKSLREMAEKQEKERELKTLDEMVAFLTSMA